MSVFKQNHGSGMCRRCRCSMSVYTYACMCLDVRCCQTMCFDVCAAEPFDDRRVRCQVMCLHVCAAHRSIPCEGSNEVSIGDQNADPRLCIRQRSPAISHTINPVFTTYSRSPHCFITINYSFVTFNYSFVKLAHTYTKARKPEPPDGHCATERPAFCCS